jgi:hypothetical protein
MRAKPTQNKIRPCAISPNITPKKNGKVMAVNILGLIY